MSQRVAFYNDNGGVSVLIPTEECLKLHSIEEIAAKDVPAGINFWIVDEEQIPQDRNERDLLNLEDFGEPTGVGGELSEFIIQIQDFEIPEPPIFDE